MKRMQTWIFITIACLTALSFGSAQAASRELTYSEMDTITVTAPVLNVITATPNSTVRVDVSYSGGKWENIYHGTGTDLNGYPILLEDYPDQVRVGLQGYYTASLYIDGVALIKPDGSQQLGSSAVAVNNASSPNNALAFDGSYAVANHSISAPDNFDGVMVNFTYGGGKPSFTPNYRPIVALQPPRYGVYVGNYDNGDPYQVPPGQMIEYDEADVAPYDYSIMQAENATQFAHLKSLNPNHRIILRGDKATGDFLGYYYNSNLRTTMKQDVVFNEISPVAQYLHGYTLNEEEAQHLCNGWYSETVPDWMTPYIDEYESETQNSFVWQSGALKNWLASKITYLYNDLYTYIKSYFPNLKVYPWIGIPDDCTGWGWIDPIYLNKDGWIYQWQDWGIIPVLHAAVHPTVSNVWAPENRIEYCLDSLRDAGIPEDELHVQVWGFQQWEDNMEQTAQLRNAGVVNIFNFYYAGTMVPDPPANNNDNELRFVVNNPNGTPLITQLTAETTMYVGYGLAQSFVAPQASLGSVAIGLATQLTEPHVFAVEASHEWIGGRPSTVALASSVIPTGAGPTVATLDLSGVTFVPGDLYWITIRPQAAGNWSLQGIDGSAVDPYADGEMIRWDIIIGYFDGWRVHDPDYIPGTGNWPFSYQQRLRFESLLGTERQIPVGNHSFEEGTYPYPAPWMWQGPSQQLQSTYYGGPASPDGTTYSACMNAPDYNVWEVAQNLTTKAAPSTKYTLTVDARNANGSNPLYPQFLIPYMFHTDGSALGGCPVNGQGNPTSVSLTVDPWNTYQFTWTTDETEPGTQNLQICFHPAVYQQGTVFIDDVRLTAQSIYYAQNPDPLEILNAGFEEDTGYNSNVFSSTEGIIWAVGPSPWDWDHNTSEAYNNDDLTAMGIANTSSGTWVGGMVTGSNSDYITHTLAGKAEPNTTYTLQVDIACIDAYNYPASLQAALTHDDGTPLGGETVWRTSPPSLATHTTWNTYTTTWTTDATEPGTQFMKLSFKPLGYSPTYQATVVIDNVRLTAQ